MFYQYSSFIRLMTNIPSFSWLHVWWSSQPDLNPSRNVSISLSSLGTLIFLGFVIALSCLLRGLLDKTFQGVPFCLDLFSFILVLSFHALVLGFPSSHNYFQDKVLQQAQLQHKIITSLNIFLLNVNFDKSTIGLYFILIFSIFAKFLEDQRLIAMLSIKCLNFKILQFKIMHKNKL